MKIFPLSFKLAIVVGMGLLIATIGLISVGFIVDDPATLVSLGDVWKDGSIILSMCGLLLIGSLMYHQVKGAVMFGMFAVTIVFWAVKDAWPSAVASVPRSSGETYVDFTVLADETIARPFWLAGFTYFLVLLFDISGVSFGLATMAKRFDENGDFDLFWTMLSSGIGTMVAAWTGSTPIIVTIECSSGIQDGGRTGLTSVVTAFWLLLSIFFAPLLSAIPTVATAPVLVIIGTLMCSQASGIPWNKVEEAIPAFVTIILMPLTYSITDGMIFGVLALLGFYIMTGRCFTDARAKIAQYRDCSSSKKSLSSEGESAASDVDDIDIEASPQETNFGANIYLTQDL
jgi:AGZA family xanthine/uracil permease-like MFS transporter